MRRLKDKQIIEAFQLKLHSEFQELEEMDGCEIEQWSKPKATYTETAEEILGFRNPLRKERLTKETWKKTEERRDIKTLLICKTRNKIEELQREYNNKARDVKKHRARTAQRKWTSDLAEKAQRAANKYNMKEVYQIMSFMTENSQKLTYQKQRQKNTINKYKETNGKIV